MNSMARRMFELVEPIGVIPYSPTPTRPCPSSGSPTTGTPTSQTRGTHGLRPSRGGGRARVYNFAPGEVAEDIPKVWRTTTPEAAIAARQAGCVKALRRILGDHVDSPGLPEAAGPLARGRDQRTGREPADGAPCGGDADPRCVVARLFHRLRCCASTVASDTRSPDGRGCRSPGRSHSSGSNELLIVMTGRSEAGSGPGHPADQSRPTPSQHSVRGPRRRH